MQGGLYVLRCFLFVYLFFFIYNDSRQTNYFKIYQTNLRQIFRVDRTMAVDDQPEISFSVPQRTLPWKTIFVGFIHRKYTVFLWFYPQNWFAGCRRLVAQPGGLTLGFTPHLVYNGKSFSGKEWNKVENFCKTLLFIKRCENNRTIWLLVGRSGSIVLQHIVRSSAEVWDQTGLTVNSHQYGRVRCWCHKTCYRPTSRVLRMTEFVV